MTVAQPDRSIAIDMYRGIAALAVFATHFTAWLTPLPSIFGTTLTHLGVLLFILLSGYCIHGQLVNRRRRYPDAQLHLSSFARRRLRRLYPAYLGAIGLGLLALVVQRRAGVAVEPQWGSVGDVLAHLALVHNLYEPYFAGVGNGPLWSIGMEFQFYAAYPLALLVVYRFGWHRTVLVALLIGMAYPVLTKSLLGANSMVQGSSPVTLFWAWLLGAMICEYRDRMRGFGSWRVCLPLLALTAALSFEPRLHYVRDAALLFCFSSLILISLRYERHRILPAPAQLLAKAGVFSYSIYLVHAPLLLMIAAVAPGPNPIEAAAYVIVILVLAYGFFCVLERPFMTPPRAPGGAQPA